MTKATEPHDTGVPGMMDALHRALSDMSDIAIACSGGVDSMTLAHIAHATGRAQIFHAVSPAVPQHATDRVRAHATRHDWALAVVGAGEFEDPDYLKNPLNRCYFCKTNLYARLRAATDATICSGTNTDDLGDFRPGLGAAAEQGVRHPFVEAGIDKSGIRRLAAHLGLGGVADLPAQPCLASRVETGLPILAPQLDLIDRVERQAASALGPGDIRCRITRAGVWLELPDPQRADQALRQRVADEASAAGLAFAGIRAYARGSAFLKDPA